MWQFFSSKRPLLLKSAFKVFISVSLLYAALELAGTNIQSPFALISKSPSIIAAIAGLFLLQIMLIAVRQNFLAKSLNMVVPVRVFGRIQFGAIFLGQVTPSNIGGDIYAWLVLSSRTSQNLKSATVIFVDKFVALFGICVIILSAIIVCLYIDVSIIHRLTNQLTLLSTQNSLPNVVAKMAAAIVIILTLVYALRERIFDFIYPLKEKFRNLLRDFRKTHGWLFLSISCLFAIFSALNLVFIVACIASIVSVDVDVEFLGLALVFLSSLIIGMLPVSVAGWGTRELSMIFGLQALGISMETALMISICFGLTFLILSLPLALYLCISWVAKQSSKAT
jgi:glycosyltransferase 2 family protein